MPNATRIGAAATLAIGALNYAALAQIANEDLKILADDGVAVDFLGDSIAIGDGVIVVGALLEDENGVDAGAAYVFDAVTGQQLLKLLPDDPGEAGDFFGDEVAMGNGVIAVSASHDNFLEHNSGSVYLFDAITGDQLHFLVPSDPVAWASFGSGIAMGQAVVVIGKELDENEAGSAYLFDVNTGTQLSRFTASDREPDDNFGRRVDIDGDLVVVGAWHDDNVNGVNAGAVYLFDVTDPASPVQLSKVTANDGDASDFFGVTVALDDGVLAVGAANDRRPQSDLVNTGSVYLFDVSNPASPIQIHKLIPQPANMTGQFVGDEVAIDNGIVVVSALNAVDQGVNSGAVFMFDASTGNQLAMLLPTDPADADLFGFSVAINGGKVAIGSRLDDNENGQNAGSAYLYSLLTIGICPADIAAPFGILDLADINVFIAGFLTQDPISDLDGDALFDLVDINIFISAFLAGCT